MAKNERNIKPIQVTGIPQDALDLIRPVALRYGIGSTSSCATVRFGFMEYVRLVRETDIAPKAAEVGS